MNEYVINNDLLYFKNNGLNSTLIEEKRNNFMIKIDCFKFLKKCCYCFGHSYSIQRQFIIDKFDYSIKTPIVVSEYNGIIVFPTSSPSSKECIWLSYNNIDRYIKEENGTKVYFNGGKTLKFNVPYRIIDNQITRCIKIEKFLNNIKNLVN